MQEPDDRTTEEKPLRFLLSLSAVGISLVLSIVMGLALGVWLDGLLNTAPVFTLIFLIVGIAAGFVGLYHEAKKAIRP